MFNPEQVARLQEHIRSNRNASQFEGRQIRTLRIPHKTLNNLSADSDIQTASEELFSPPDIIIGEPVERSSLHGLDRTSFSVPKPKLRVVRNGTIIGNTSILTEDGTIFFPDPIQPSNISAFDFEVNRGHQGFVISNLSEKDDELTFLSRANPRRYALNALFLHNLEPANFGSFIFRQLPQILYLKEFEVDFDCFITPARTPWLMETLWILGLDHYPIFTLAEVIGETFSSIAFYNRFDAEGMFNQETFELVRRFSLRAQELNNVPIHRSEKIYVSRALTALTRPHYRQLINEIDVEDFVSKRGYLIIYPETLNFRQQISTFACAKKILGPSGSGLFSAAFSGPSAKILDVETYNVSVRLRAKLYSSTGNRYAFGFVAPDSTDPSPLLRRRWSMPQDILEKSVEWLEE